MKILEIMLDGYAGGPYRKSSIDVSDFTDEEVSSIIVCNTDPNKGQWCRVQKEKAEPGYCKHGNYIGNPYGPDHICGHCE
jgi:hypothetical protein